MALTKIEEYLTAQMKRLHLGDFLDTCNYRIPPSNFVEVIKGFLIFTCSHILLKIDCLQCANYEGRIFCQMHSHYENTPMQYTAIFHGSKNERFLDKKLINFLILAQNIDCG